MNGVQLGSRPEDFIWATGIEDSFIPQWKRGHRALDEYGLMGHYKHWREDLALTRELGMGMVRWGVPWYRVEPIPGEFDWRWTDQVIPYMVEELGITPIVDLMHYGCPFWLRGEFINSDYPQAVATYTRAFVERYKSLVRWYTPLNEPLINAMMCGMNGGWPPYLKGEKGYVRLILQLAKGMVCTVEAIKEADPEARLVFVEAAGITRASEPSLRDLAEEQRLRGFVVFDLLTGRVTPDHPIYGWLVSAGASRRELANIAGRPVAIDVMGLNFYPQWSTQELYINETGQVVSRVCELDGVGFGEMVEDFYRRYGVPIMITETSARDCDVLRSAWLANSLHMIKGLRAEGVPVLGYTWFPLFTMIDWRYRWERGPLNDYLLELGLYTLNTDADGKRWRPSPLVEQMRGYIANPEGAIGRLAVG